MSDDAFAAGTRERPLGGRRSGTDNLRALPQILDHALIRPIGRGSYGDVWLARSVLGTYRAVKIIYRHTFKEAHPFEREYNGIQKFEPISRSHDGLVDILQIGRNDPDGYFYYVMELADDAEPGRSNGVLESWSNGPTRTAQHSATPALQNVGSYTPKTIRTEISRRGRLPFEECLQLSLSLTSALGRLHKAGLVHRDIKPSNIIFVNGAPKLADIGLVTDVGEAKSFVGTEGFIPPEGPGTAQADIYSLGKVLYEIATGKDRQSFPEPPTLLEEFADRKQLLELNEIILKACENDPSKRYRSVEEMREELELLQVGKSVRRLRVMERRLAILTRSAWAAGAVALVLGAGFLFAMHEKDQAQQARAHAEDLVGQLELEKAELLFAADNTSAALAYLARCLRESPSNRVAASRLISAMAQRAFPLPVDVVLQHDKPIGSAQFSPDGGRIVTASADGTAKVWDAASGQALLELELGARGLWAAFSPDGSKIVTAVELGTVQLWDAATGRPLGAPWQHSSRVLFADFSPEGDRVVVAAGNNAHIWNVRFGQVVVTGFNHQDEVTCARFSPDGKKIITASFDGKARVWDASSGKTSELTLSNGRRLWTAEISPDGQRALTGGGGSARVYDLRSGQLLAETGKGESEIDWAQFSSDGRRIVTTCQDHSIRIWDASTGRPASESVHVGNPPRFAAFSPDGRRLLTGLGDNRVRLWQVPLQVSAAITLRHGAPVQSVHFSPDGNLLATVDGESAQIWDIRAGRLVTPPLRHAPAGSVRVHFSPDGEWIATGSWDRTARIWSVHSGEPRTDALVHGGPLNSVQFNPDSKQLLTGAYDGEARLWDAQTGRFLKSVKHTNQLTSAQFSPDGRKIVTASLDKTARIWDVRAGKLVCPPLEHKDTVWFAQFSTDGNSIVTASADKTARVWDANTGQARTAPMTHKGVVHHAQFSPDGRWVVTRSPDTTARLWNARTGQPAGEPLQHAGEVLSVTFSPDGQRVLTASNDHAARVWDVLSGQLIAEALRYGGAIHWAEFNPDGTWVATACEDGSARLWEVPIVAAAAPSWLSDLAEGVAGQRFTAERTLVTVPGGGPPFLEASPPGLDP